MKFPTFTDFLEDQADPETAGLLLKVAQASASIASKVRNGAFENALGLAGSTNIQGEEQKALDVIADEEVQRICGPDPKLAALVSEEIEEVQWLKEPEEGDFLLYYDPLDGSSNLDVNLSVGTIFAVAQVRESGSRDVLVKGDDLLCAGYAIYGPSTMLVLSLGDGVDGFTLNPEDGKFHLTHPKMSIPVSTKEFAINASRKRYWDAPFERYIKECQAGETGPRGKNFGMRWAASMVADVHRIMIRGGIFMYPTDKENRPKGGKLRLLYEANPMSFLVEQAGGAATDGHLRIRSLQPTGHHQRVSVVLGSKEEVDLIARYHEEV